jgi:hypothetical protein
VMLAISDVHYALLMISALFVIFFYEIIQFVIIDKILGLDGKTPPTGQTMCPCPSGTYFDITVTPNLCSPCKPSLMCATCDYDTA